MLRPATSVDLPAIRELVHAVLTEHGLPFDAEESGDLFDLETYRGGMFDVLERDGAIVGSVGLAPVGDATCELRRMYLVPAARGAGEGRQLLEHALRCARDRGFRRIELLTAAPLAKARRLYERAGFRRVERPASQGCDLAYALDLDA